MVFEIYTNGFFVEFTVTNPTETEIAAVFAMRNSRNIRFL